MAVVNSPKPLILELSLISQALFFYFCRLFGFIVLIQENILEKNKDIYYMSYKGMRGATLKYMNSIDKQSKSLRRNIKNIKKEIESTEHILYMVDNISSRLGFQKEDDPDWNALIKKYTDLKIKLVEMVNKDNDLIDEYNNLVDGLDDVRSRNKSIRLRGKRTIKKSLAKPFAPGVRQTTRKRKYKRKQTKRRNKKK